MFIFEGTSTSQLQRRQDRKKHSKHRRRINPFTNQSVRDCATARRSNNLFFFFRSPYESLNGDIVHNENVDVVAGYNISSPNTKGLFVWTRTFELLENQAELIIFKILISFNKLQNSIIMKTLL
jgi:hypothetical protein